MSVAPCVVGRCHVVCRDTRDFVPPLHLFPELSPFALHEEWNLDLRPVSDLVDTQKSSWTVIELASPGSSSASVPQQTANSVRITLEKLAKRGLLNVGYTQHPQGGAHPLVLPTSADLVAALQTFVEAMPGWRDDPDAVAAILSPHFLQLLAFQRLEQMKCTSAATTRPDHAATHSKRHRSEDPAVKIEAQDSHGSVDPWDASQNAPDAPSISLDEAGPITELAAVLHRISKKAWRSFSSVGIQTDVRLPGTRWTQPLATLPETTQCPSVKRDGGVEIPSLECRAALRLNAADGADKKFDLSCSRTTYLGRGGEAIEVADPWHVRLGASRRLTRLEHCAIHPVTKFDDTKQTTTCDFFLTVLGRNGVKVNGHWYHSGPVKLAHGDTIIIDGIALEFIRCDTD